MKKLLFTFFLMVSLMAQAEVIPLDKRVEWDKAGYQYLSTEPQLRVNVMDYGAIANGESDDKPAIEKAITSLKGRCGIVYLPAGHYLLQSGLVLPDSVILRGDGSEFTFLKINSTDDCFSINGSATGIFTSVISGFEINSNQIIVKNPKLFVIGNYVEIRQDNGSWDTKPASWANKVVGQISKITDIIGDKLILEDKLRTDFDASLKPEIQKIIPRKHVRVENLNIERTNNNEDGCANNFQFSYAVNCLISGVESNKSGGSHVKVCLSSHIEITGSYFHHAYMYDGVGTRGYGVVLDTHSGLCLVSNNIFKYLRHSMMIKAGANGNVFAYNYSTNVYRNGANEFPADFSADISLHGHYSFANLFEGNIVQNIIIDDYWGPSGQHNTFFRNRVEHYGIFMSTSNTNNTNFVGNEIVGAFPHGFFLLSGKGNFLFGNNRNGTISPTTTTELSDYSYYYQTTPSFWDIPDQWPSIGITNKLNAGTIPAKNRFNAGIYTVSSDDLSSPSSKILSNQDKKYNNLEVIPNPASQYVFVDINSTGNMESRLIFSDLNGKIIKQGIFYFVLKGIVRKTIDISSFSNGVYFMKLETVNGVFIQKLIVR